MRTCRFRAVGLADAPLENNIVERALKKAIIHRKNSLFFRTERGADVGDLYMSIIYAAELNGVNPFQYLADLLRHQKAVAANPAAWLPWAYRDAPPTAQPRAAPLAV